MFAGLFMMLAVISQRLDYMPSNQAAAAGHKGGMGIVIHQFESAWQ
jgi:hypothetical protein